MCFAGWLFINGFKVQIQLELDESSKTFDLHAWPEEKCWSFFNFQLILSLSRVVLPEKKIWVYDLKLIAFHYKGYKMKMLIRP